MLKRIIFIYGLVACMNVFGQDPQNNLQKTFRINLLNPGFEYEFPIFMKSTIAVNPGIGFHSSYLNLDYTNSGITYYISPFLDLAYRMIYNQEKRASKGKNISYNSGNYWGLRFLTNFKEFKSMNIYRKDDISFEFGPTWGIQSDYGKMHLLFDVGPVYYFDTKGNNGFFPIMLQLNLGFNLKNDENKSTNR